MEKDLFDTIEYREKIIDLRLNQIEINLLNYIVLPKFS